MNVTRKLKGVELEPFCISYGLTLLTFLWIQYIFSICNMLSSEIFCVQILRSYTFSRLVNLIKFPDVFFAHGHFLGVSFKFLWHWSIYLCMLNWVFLDFTYSLLPLSFCVLYYCQRCRHVSPISVKQINFICIKLTNGSKEKKSELSLEKKKKKKEEWREKKNKT